MFCKFLLFEFLDFFRAQAISLQIKIMTDPWHITIIEFPATISTFILGRIRLSKQDSEYFYHSFIYLVKKRGTLLVPLVRINGWLIAIILYNGITRSLSYRNILLNVFTNSFSITKITSSKRILIYLSSESG